MSRYRPYAACVIGTIVVSALVGSTLISAQDGGASQSDQVIASNTGVADIVVTAKKRAERLQDVPIAITAFGSADLEKQNVTSITNFTKLAVPGLVSTAFVGSPTLSLNILGISTQDPSSATMEAPVAVYVDGVYIPRSVGLGLEILDIERVEILCGPQGTLFGRNADGGALPIVTKQPTGKFGGSIGGTLANFRREKVYAHINTPS